jgi:hypothetical protein
MSTQPEALRLADKLAPAGTHSLAWCKEAADELRQLHEVNKELLELLERVAEALAHCMGYAYEPVVEARIAITKAVGETK